MRFYSTKFAPVTNQLPSGHDSSRPMGKYIFVLSTSPFRFPNVDLGPSLLPLPSLTPRPSRLPLSQPSYYRSLTRSNLFRNQSELFPQLCSEEDVEGVKKLIADGFDVNAPIPYAGEKMPPIRIAAVHSPEIIKLLLEAGAAVDGTIEFSGTALVAAIAHGGNKWRGKVMLFLRWGADVNAPAGTYGTALQEAVKKNDEPIIRLLLDHGADVNQSNSRGYGTALTTATEYANISVVKLLLNAGADPNALGPHGCGNALIYAVARSDESMVRLLLKWGADCNAKVSFG